ncbi:MAG: NADH-quinone oxidoreductase subunit NuoK [Opitutales bacterium]|nr:NADH-quinone oxidoreductase subunit NuoK [Opitutales bacterium]
MTLSTCLILAGLLFVIGLVGAMFRRNVVTVFMSLEMMLIASMLGFVAFAKYTDTVDGVLVCFFIFALAAAEVAVGLSVIVAYYRLRQSASLDDLNSLKN